MLFIVWVSQPLRLDWCLTEMKCLRSCYAMSALCLWTQCQSHYRRGRWENLGACSQNLSLRGYRSGNSLPVHMLSSSWP